MKKVQQFLAYNKAKPKAIVHTSMISWQLPQNTYIKLNAHGSAKEKTGQDESLETALVIG